MPKPKGGKKKKRGKKNTVTVKRDLEFRDETQAYGRVVKMMGDGRIQAKCSDGEVRTCHIRGKMRKRIWINPDDLILVDIRSYQEDKADVVYKYTLDEDRTLQSYGELTGGTAKEEQDEDDGGVFMKPDSEIDYSDDNNNNNNNNNTTSESEDEDMETLLSNL